MGTSKQNKALKLVQKPNVIPTQICVPVDCSSINRSIYYPPILQIYHDSTQLTSYDYKNEPIHKISHELHQYMPCGILVLLTQFVLLLLHVRLSKALRDFPTCHCQILFFRLSAVFFIYTQRLVARSASARCYLHSQLGFGRVIMEKLKS